MLEDVRDVAVGADTDIDAADDEIVSSFIADFVDLVGFDASVLIVPLREQEADGAFSELWEVAIDEPGVLASKLDLTAEAQIVADEHGSTGDNPGWERLVVRVPEPQHPAIILTRLLSMDFHEPEVASAVVSEAVRLRADGQLGGGERALDGLDELMMWNRLPRRGGPWRFHRAHLIECHGLCAAVEDEVGVAPGFGSRRQVE